MKKSAGKSLAVLTAFVLSFSCGLTEIGSFVEDESNGAWTGPSVSPPSVARSILYVTAFDYPEGYDWRSDPEKGSVRCSLTVFADGRPILKVPVGDRYYVSSDPDMHRIIDGHLYTDFATDTETIIKKDGKVHISYEGRESIVAMTVIDDAVHTLGQNRDGKGFSYRIDGESVIERNNGYVYCRLSEYEGKVSFTFSEPINSVDGGKERYYFYRDGQVHQTALREDIRKVWDVVVHCGQVYYLATLVGMSEPVIVSESSLDALSLPYQSSLVTGRLFCMGEELGSEMILMTDSGLNSVLWLQNVPYRVFDAGMTVSSLYSGSDGVACALNTHKQEGGGVIFRMGESIPFPQGYVCMGGSPLDLTDGMLTVGLSSLTGGNPIIWRDGEMEELDINGYICTISSREL